MQYAGGIGFISVAAGYSNKKERIEGDLYFGYAPASVAGITIHSLTGKFTSYPVKPFSFHKLQVKPLSVGMFVNYTFGKQYFGFNPDNYPYSYYKNPTVLNLAIFAGGQVYKKTNGKIKQVGFYYEVISFDREIISYLSNTRSLKIIDILNLAIGIRVSRKKN